MSPSTTAVPQHQHEGRHQREPQVTVADVTVHPAGLPPRCRVLQATPMLLSFDVDCGELLPGHRFVARGLSGPERLQVDGPLDSGAVDDGFFLEYELVPGVPASPSSSVVATRVRVSFDAGGAFPADLHDGGAIAPFVGGPTTHGSRGPWPLPPGARVLTFALTGPVVTGAEAVPAPVGRLVVDLDRRDAHWELATTPG